MNEAELTVQEKDIFRFEAQFGTEMLEILNNSSTISTPINRDNEPVNNTDQGTDQATDQGTDQKKDHRIRYICQYSPKLVKKVPYFRTNFGLSHTPHPKTG